MTAGFSAVVVGTVAAAFRPLLFCSVNPDVAAVRGVPVQQLAIGFMVLVAIAVAIAVQVVGVLLIFTLLIGPAATATRLVARPPAAIGLAVGLGLAYTWLGIMLAATLPWPVSFFIATLSFGVYLPVRLLAPGARPRPAPAGPAPPPPAAAREAR